MYIHIADYTDDNVRMILPSADGQADGTSQRIKQSYRLHHIGIPSYSRSG